MLPACRLEDTAATEALEVPVYKLVVSLSRKGARTRTTHRESVLGGWVAFFSTEKEAKANAVTARREPAEKHEHLVIK